MPNAKGHGRTKGTPNKNTADMVALVREALEKRGGIRYLLQLDDEHFVKLLTRIVPNQVKAELAGGAEITLRIERSFVKPKGEPQ